MYGTTVPKHKALSRLEVPRDLDGQNEGWVLSPAEYGEAFLVGGLGQLSVQGGQRHIQPERKS